MLCSRAADFCRRSPASRKRLWPSVVTKNNAARKLMMRNGGIATYQRPRPSNASLTNFMLIILLTNSSAVHQTQPDFGATHVPRLARGLWPSGEHWGGKKSQCIRGVIIRSKGEDRVPAGATRRAQPGAGPAQCKDYRF